MVIMTEIKQLELKAYTYLIDKDPGTWCRAFFEEDRTCDALENGISESFNAWTLQARGRPLITMLEEIRVMVMERLEKQRQKVGSWDDGICPAIKRKLEKLKQKQRVWNVAVSGGTEFEVRNGYEGYHVHIDKHCCSCRVWQISGIPCVHSVAALAYMNVEPSSYVSSWFTTHMWKKSYNYSIKPLNGSSLWRKTPYTPPLPPKNRRMPGRPTVKRKKDDSEQSEKCQKNTSGKGLIRAGRDMTCSKCKEKGHNKRGCKKDAKAPADSQVVQTPAESQVVQADSQVVQTPAQVVQTPAQVVQTPAPQHAAKLPVKRRRPSERILKKKLSKPWFDEDGKGTSSSNPMEME